jgi:hypothetical protein
MRERDFGVRWFNTVFYPEKKIAGAARYEDGVLPRLREPHVTLFTAWGPRYSWENRGVNIREGDREVEVLSFLATLFDEWKRKMGEKFEWVFLGADLYGTRINNLSAGIVASYFASLAEWLKRILPMAEFLLWSDFDNVAEEYRQQIEANFNSFVSADLLRRATHTAESMGRGGDPKAYLVERMAEAMLIEEMVHPIKISCVGKHKDEEVDLELPRLYFLPERLHAPWL